MAKIEQCSTVEVEITLRLSEAEARALAALPVYGADAFLKAFYTNLGRYYLEGHEAGLRSLFDGIEGELPVILRCADAARAAFARGLVPTAGTT